MRPTNSTWSDQTLVDPSYDQQAAVARAPSARAKKSAQPEPGSALDLILRERAGSNILPWQVEQYRQVLPHGGMDIRRPYCEGGRGKRVEDFMSSAAKEQLRHERGSRQATARTPAQSTPTGDGQGTSESLWTQPVDQGAQRVHSLDNPPPYLVLRTAKTPIAIRLPPSLSNEEARSPNDSHVGGSNAA